MQIRAGYEIVYQVSQPTPMLLMLTPHPSRHADLLSPHQISFTHPQSDQPVAARTYTDGFGNLCTRILAPAGQLTIATQFLIADSGAPDVLSPEAAQHPIEELPDEALVFLLGSRYCDTDAMSDIAWATFGSGPTGWHRVQAVCDYVHTHIVFNYQHASATRTASDAHRERRGVCRDYAHLAVTLCRCLNIPARYCTGFLGDMGTPPPYGPMDFAAWFEVYLGGAWHSFDARNNTPRIGRILLARGRDATDVAIATTFGPCSLTGFTVITDELPL